MEGLVMTERTFKREENPVEYSNLEKVANILTALSESIRYEVKDCYLDFGLNWMWTTIIANDPNESGVLSSWQAINPRQWREIIESESDCELLDVVKSIISK